MLPIKTLFMPHSSRRRLFTLFLLQRHRHLHSHSRSLPPAIQYPLTHPIYTVWAANTSLGKTLVSAGLSIAFLHSSGPNIAKKFIYLKPVQTGFPIDSDSRFVYLNFADFCLRNRPQASVFASNYVLYASVPASKALLGECFKSGDFESGVAGESEKAANFENLGWYEERNLQGVQDGEAPGLGCFELVCKTFYGWREPISPHLAVEREGARVEDSELLEMLKRGLEFRIRKEAGEGDGGGDMIGDVMCVIETAGGVSSPGPSGALQCDLYRMPVLMLPPIPQDMSDNLIDWFDKSQPVLSSLKGILLSAFEERIKNLHHMPKRASDIFWWPFTQHELVPEENITLIDSRCGGNFAIYKASKLNVISEQFDACASWWTQGPDADLQVVSD